MKISGAKEKVRNMLDDFISLDFFQNEIKELRKKFDIPERGFKFTDAEKADCKSKSIFHKPAEFKGDRAQLRDLNLEISKLATRFPIRELWVKNFFRLYLFYNVFVYEVLKADSENLLKVVDLDDQYWDLYWDDSEPKIYLDAMQAENAIRPIAIRIHPLASQRDLIDYIRKNWSLIHYYQQKYAKSVKRVYKLGDVRKRDEAVRERNTFIYENKDKSIKEIRRMLAKKKQFLDDGHISKIISMERKRRKQVPFT